MNNQFSYTLFGSTLNLMYMLNNITKQPIGSVDINLYIMFLIYFYMFSRYSNTMNAIKNNIQEIREKASNPNIINKYIRRTNDSMILNEHDQNDISNEELIKKILLKQVSNDIETSLSIEWTLFEKITKNEWDSFTLLGYKVNDLSILKKMFGVIVFLTAGSSATSSVGDYITSI